MNDIPKTIETAIGEITSGLSEKHHQHARETLETSWRIGGVGVITKNGSDFQYHAQWLARSIPGEATVWLGSLLVVIESHRAVATGA